MLRVGTYRVELSHWFMSLKDVFWSLSCLCLLCHHDIPPCLRPNTVEATGHGLKTLSVTCKIKILTQGIIIERIKQMP